MTEIPDDILAAAKRAAYATEATGYDTAAITSLAGIDVIAAAILTERERCAQAVRDYLQGEYFSDFVRLAVANEVLRSPAKTEEPAP